MRWLNETNKFAKKSARKTSINSHTYITWQNSKKRIFPSLVRKAAKRPKLFYCPRIPAHPPFSRISINNPIQKPSEHFHTIIRNVRVLPLARFPQCVREGSRHRAIRIIVLFWCWTHFCRVIYRRGCCRDKSTTGWIAVFCENMSECRAGLRNT